MHRTIVVTSSAIWGETRREKSLLLDPIFLSSSAPASATRAAPRYRKVRTEGSINTTIAAITHPKIKAHFVARSFCGGPVSPSLDGGSILGSCFSPFISQRERPLSPAPPTRQIPAFLVLTFQPV